MVVVVLWCGGGGGGGGGGGCCCYNCCLHSQVLFYAMDRGDACSSRGALASRTGSSARLHKKQQHQFKLDNP